ncbi:MAG TPA: RNA-binding S4 domain-containing protein [Synechococcales cyanobacterium M55_K2018_004]|nr:RNA-binding S4 domain-containing protein [Synechococcales cyanobacterium M55_K2018_004]
MSTPDTINKPDTIKLDQFLKWVGLVQTGGEAKLLIQSGEVKVNGAVELRRGRQLVTGDRVSAMGETLTVRLTPPQR